MPRQVTPKVFLIAATVVDQEGISNALEALGVPDWQTDAPSDAEHLIEFAGKSCYMSFSVDLNKNLTKIGGRNNFDYIQHGIIGTKHGSVLEHATVTFFIHDVSRIFTHELVRHRVGTAFSQLSGRYVRSDEIRYYMPSQLAGTPAAAFFHAAFGMMEVWQKKLASKFQMDELKDFDLKKKLTSAFRRLIGNGQTNSIVFTANHNALRHIIELRTSRHAEEEIRLVFNMIYEVLISRYKALYADAKMDLVDGLYEITFGHMEDPVKS